MQLPDLDLRHLQAFVALMKEKNIRKASEALGMSQPAMSRALAKLRQGLNDPLFVATSRGIEPTSCALAMLDPISQIIALASDRLTQLVQFEPLTCERKFSIAASDIGELMLIPALMRDFATLAPHVRLHAYRPTSRLLAADLQSGDVDLAVGAFPVLSTGIHCKRLFTERYVCLTRQVSPGSAASEDVTLSEDRFLASSHIVVAAGELGHRHSEVERVLLDTLPSSAVKVTSSSFLLSALLTAESDCILVAPSTLARIMHKRCSLNVLPCPIATEPFDIVMYWHERSHGDPAHKWLRDMIAERFSDHVAQPLAL